MSAIMANRRHSRSPPELLAERRFLAAEELAKLR